MSRPCPQQWCGPRGPSGEAAVRCGPWVLPRACRLVAGGTGLGQVPQAGAQAAPLHALAGGTPEHEKLCRARDQCREILKYVNEAVKETENRQRVEGYQKRLDTTSLERASNPLAAEFKVRGGEQPALQHTRTPPGPRGAGSVGCGGQGASRALAPWPAGGRSCQ